jgi:small-conductance mechanosensitive channel
MATLGVGGIAVSFALKDTFANVFSGFYVSLAGQLHRGDFIRLDRSTAGFVEGYVMDIHWRITTLLTLDNNMVLIPNSKLAEAIVTNFSQPAAPLSVSIPYGVAYDTDIALLDRVVLDVVKSAIGEVAGLLPEPAPVNRLTPGFGDSALNFTLSVSVTSVAAQFAVADLLRRRLLARFRQEGIRIPFPTRTLEVHREPGSPPPAS